MATRLNLANLLTSFDSSLFDKVIIASAIDAVWNGFGYRCHLIRTAEFMIEAAIFIFIAVLAGTSSKTWYSKGSTGAQIADCTLLISSFWHVHREVRIPVPVYKMPNLGRLPTFLLTLRFYAAPYFVVDSTTAPPVCKGSCKNEYVELC